jgi:hypothetical protein
MTKQTSGQAACPGCNKPATGNFCQNCGTQLGGRFCNQCGGSLSAGAKFCNKCGNKASVGARAGAGRGSGGAGGDGGSHRAAAAAAVGGENLGWWLAGAAMFVLILVVGWQTVRGGNGPQPAAAGSAVFGGTATGASAIDLSTMTPIDAANRLFDRIMRAIAAGDSIQAQQFMPMALNAYEIAEPLDEDALFHLSMLQRTAFQLEDALASAQRILVSSPDHLLGLIAAGEAASELGETEVAIGYYRQIVSVYDGQMASPLPEYLDHSGITEGLKVTAEAFLAGR